MTGTVAKVPIQKKAPASSPMSFLNKMNPATMMGFGKKPVFKPKSELDMDDGSKSLLPPGDGMSSTPE